MAFHSGQQTKLKKAALRDFESLRDGSPRVFVSSFRDGGTGNNLHTANYQILTGPLRLPAWTEQAFGRTSREGQQLPLHHMILLTEDNAKDRMLAATLAQLTIVSDPFRIDEELRFAE